MVRLGIRTIVGAMFLCVSLHGAMAAPFQNLDFEEAFFVEPESGDFSVLASEALPHWTVFRGGAVPTEIVYNTMALDAPCISIHDGKASQSSGCLNPLQGTYSVMLQSGSRYAEQEQAGSTGVSIFQIGDIPTNARSIQFLSDMMPVYPYEENGLSGFEVSVGGSVIPLMVHSVGTEVNTGRRPVYTYAGDISGFAGQTNVSLAFTTTLFLDSVTVVDLDAIVFSTEEAPEPSAMILLGTAALGILAYSWRSRTYRKTEG